MMLKKQTKTPDNMNYNKFYNIINPHIAAVHQESVPFQIEKLLKRQETLNVILRKDNTKKRTCYLFTRSNVLSGTINMDTQY